MEQKNENMIRDFKISLFTWCLAGLFGLSACNDMEDMPHVDAPVVSGKGQLYILSEGLFNLNNSTLALYDFETQQLQTDFFQTCNRRGLGDTGNDMGLYGGKLYIAVNVSSQIEVLQAATGRSLARIPLFNEAGVARQPRYLAFDGGKVYVTCYDGYVARIDTVSLEVDALAACGRNPEGLCVANGKLYVANSGGLDYPDYDNTVSVIDLATFQERKRITVGMNPGRVAADSRGNVYVVSRGNYDDIPYRFQKIDGAADGLARSFDDIQALDFTISDDIAYIYHYNHTSGESWVKVFDCATEQVLRDNFITDGTVLETPYSINAIGSDVYITEAYNFTVWGDVLCFSADGRLKFRLNDVGLNPNKVVLAQLSEIASDTAQTSGSPYINRVWEYMPAPGQFVNTETSAYETGFTADDVLAQANARLLQSPAKGALLSLGAWGGYIVVGFDHTIPNVPGEYDFKVYGNAYNGSAEPGIVLVSADANGNGLPDDEWYELAGSEYGNPEVLADYEVTYFRPEQPSDSVCWTDNRGQSGYVARVSYHGQAYYPAWLEADSYTLRGRRLPGNATNTATPPAENWVLASFPWGYADNQSNASDGSNFKIDWAVDKDGKSVQLAGIDFVKIYTAVQQNCGWIGETSTEFCNIEDLHYGQD